MTYNYNDWLKNNKPKIFCKCGCGKEILIQKHHKYNNISEYVKGHYWFNKPRSKESKQKMRKSKLGKKRSEETKRKIRIKLMGHVTSEETKRKIFISESGKKVSEETKRKMRGKKKSEETKKKISMSLLGMVPWNKGLVDIYSEETKIKMSNSHKGVSTGRLPSIKCGYGKRSYYNSPLQGKIYLRSSYELVYAKYLDDHKILWMYEMETFNLGDTTYTPDFFLPQFEKFIEVKGYMRPEAQDKINKFLEQYPWDLEILYKKDLIKLGINIK